jgi:hypothetical protein
MSNPVRERLAKFESLRETSSHRRSIADLLAPLEEIAAHSSSLVASHGANFKVAGETYKLPRYLFIGPQGGATAIRVGIFAAIHGDESEGAYAVVQFLKLLEARPALATGYSLFVYPVCNPTGFEDNTRHSRSGKDLNCEFWASSREPEVQLLQAELISRSFQGIISLRTDAQADGFYGIARGATLTRQLLAPALRVAETFLPRDQRSFINGFHAREGVIEGGEKGALSAPPKIHPQPFEITLEMPVAPPAYVKESTFAFALKTILTEYRKFIAYAQNI